MFAQETLAKVRAELAKSDEDGKAQLHQIEELENRIRRWISRASSSSERSSASSWSSRSASTKTLYA